MGWISISHVIFRYPEAVTQRIWLCSILWKFETDRSKYCGTSERGTSPIDDRVKNRVSLGSYKILYEAVQTLLRKGNVSERMYPPEDIQFYPLLHGGVNALAFVRQN